MRHARSAALLVTLALVACESTPGTGTDRAAVALKGEGVTVAGGDGSSLDNAIIVHAPSAEIAVVAGYEYILLRYRLWQLTKHQLVHRDGKFYQVATYDDTVTMGPFPTRKERVFYFDLSEYFVKRHKPSNQSLQPTPSRLVSFFSND